MSRGTARRALIAAVMLLVLAPASASAWTVTIHVHGAGGVLEVANRFGDNQGQMNCLIAPDGRSNGSVTDCVGGSANGLYTSGNIVRLMPQVSAAAGSRGWHFDHWTDSKAGGGLINCDPQEDGGNFSSPAYCEFQIFENLRADIWFTDTTGPSDTVISGGPAQGSATNSMTAQFTSFSAASDPDATFQCRLDPPGQIGSFAACPRNGATFNNLAQNGTWQLSVRAVDPSGNVDTTPAVRSWIVDTTPPVVSLTNGPAQNSTTKTQTADFGVSTSDGSLVCTIDGATLASCTPPTVHIPALADGQHTFSVRGVDAVGNSSTPITRTWTVDTTPPTVTVTGGPTGTTKATSASFTVTTSEGTPTCTLDGADTPCAGAHDNLPDGSHTFSATAADALGNTSAPVSRHWTVDTVAPDVTLNGNPPTDAPTATFSFTSGDSSATFECKLDLAAFAPCTSPASFASVPNGDHTFSVRAVDAAGNVSAPATRNWTLNTTPVVVPDPHSADQDGDGVLERADCNDHDAAIHPGAKDIPADGIDQDCDGKDAKLTAVPGGIRYRFSTRGAKTTIAVLKLTQLTAPKTRVTVTCKGKGCRFKSLTAKPGKSHALDLRKLLKPLKAGQTLTIRISAPGFLAKAARFTMRRGKLPTGGAFRPT